MRTIGSMFGAGGVGSVLFLGPFQRGTRLKSVRGVLWTGAVTNGVLVSIGVYTEPVALADVGGGEFPFHVNTSTQPVVSTPPVINGAPAFCLPADTGGMMAATQEFDLPLDYEFQDAGYLGIACLSPIGESTLTVGVEVDTFQQTFIAWLASGGFGGSGGGKGGGVSVSPLSRKSEKVSGKGSASGVDMHTPHEYPAQQSTPEW